MEILTPEILQIFNPENIIYAEHCPIGAMGKSGSVTMTILNEVTGKAKTYEVRISSDKESYRKAVEVLENNSCADEKTHLLNKLYAGAGNEVYINSNYTVAVKEDGFHFSGISKAVAPSSFGIYNSVSCVLKSKIND